MATLNEQLNELQIARDEMKTALEGKGQTVTKDVRTYAEAISVITSGGGSVEGEVKLFKTVDEMNADATAKDGDIAIVYSKDYLPLKDGETISKLKFPTTIVLDSAVTSTQYTGFRGETLTNRLSINVTATKATVYCDGTDVGTITYNSTDGITYVGTHTEEMIADWGNDKLSLESYYTWNDVCAKFLFSYKAIYGGMYDYRENYQDKGYLSFIPISAISFDIDTTNSKVLNVTIGEHETYGKFSIEKISVLLHEIFDQEITFNEGFASIILQPDGTLCVYNINNEFRYSIGNSIIYDESKNYLGIGYYNSRYDDVVNVTGYKYVLDLDNMTWSKEPTECTHSYKEYMHYMDKSITSYLPIWLFDWNYTNGDSYGLFSIRADSPSITVTSLTYSETPPTDRVQNPIYSGYFISDNQFNADEEHILTGYSAYGVTGAIEGKLGKKPSEWFTDDFANTVMTAYSTPHVITELDLSKGRFKNCKFIPRTAKGEIMVDISSVTSIAKWFYENMTIEVLDLSGLDTSHITNMDRVFYYCRALKYLDISTWTFDNVTSYDSPFTEVPADCLIYVKDQAAKDWVLARRSTLTNVQIKS